MRQTKILVIDEHEEYRGFLRTAFEDVEDVEIVGEAASGAMGLQQLRRLEPDMIIASSSIRDMGADELTRQALEISPALGVVICLEKDSSDVDRVVRSLQQGAFDFSMKPELASGKTAELVTTIRRRLLPKIRSFSTAKYSRMARGMSGKSPANLGEKAGSTKSAAEILASKESVTPVGFELAVIGVSTGGPEALSKLIPALPASFPIPVAIVLHLPLAFTKSLVAVLNKRSALEVREANDGEMLRAGRVYLARGGEHLLVKRDVNNNLVLRYSNAAPMHGCKPSVDLLFESAAKACPGAVMAVILTGMGMDGVEGLRGLKKAGAVAIAQDETSSVVWGMPGRAVQENLVDFVKPLDAIAKKMCSLLDRP